MEFKLLCLLIAVGVCLGFDPANYPNTQQLLPRYNVYWRVDQTAGTFYLALQVKTTGWVGFGISELTSGSMPGSDVVVGSVVDGNATITDLWTSAYALPNTDSCQDWILVSSEESNGVTVLELKRALDTKDAQDRAIIPGPNRVIAAFGEDGMDTLQYHMSNRITSVIAFYGDSPTPPLPSDAQSFDILMDNYTVPTGETHYTCMSFSVPIDQEYHIIQIDPLVDEPNVEHIHHFLVHICNDIPNGYVSAYKTGGPCTSPLGNPDSGCTGVLDAWAAGGGSTILPSDAGFPMGPDSNSVQHLVLEIHYNNPDDNGGYIDHSGVRIWYTDQKRKYDAAMIITGDPGITLPPIQPYTLTEYETECPTLCTKTMPYEVTVFQSFPHMHLVGSEIWTTQWRNGVQIAEVGRVEFWSFNHQQAQPVNFTIQPGDRLNTHCLYDAREISNVTYFGPASTNEMCIQFFSYYPRMVDNSGNLILPFCGYVVGDTLCAEFEQSNLLNYTNPTIRDPPGGANRTFGVSGQCI